MAAAAAVSGRRITGSSAALPSVRRRSSSIRRTGGCPRSPPAPKSGGKQARGGRGLPGEWRGTADSYDDLNIYYRCVTRGLLGSVIPVIYGNGNEIVQAPGYVVFRNEMIHESRVIPLDGRPHVSKSIRMYMGDSRGHWEGDTLVVETTNFTDKVAIGSNGAGYPGDPGYHSLALRVDRAIHPHQRQRADLRSDRRRSADVGQAVDAADSADARHRSAICSSTPATKATTPCATS